MSKEKATYMHGHHTSVTTSHSKRTVQNSAAFLLPHIHPTHHILDIGCGPGSITIGLAQLVPQGSVTGGDVVPSVLQQAQSLASASNIQNITFQPMDANALPFEDGSFDVVFAHQTLQHVADPVGVLREMKRVTRRGGIVAARDADYASFAWSPDCPGLDEWLALYRGMARKGGSEPDAGRNLRRWAREAGFARDEVVFGWGVWNYLDDEAKGFAWAWVERCLHSGFAEAVGREYGVEKGREVCERLSGAWGTWGDGEELVLMIPNGEVLCTVG